ncbi:MAG: transposase [Cephaloticoccus sp.]|nr:transposase [Cephaloticoccus sp.]
MTMESTKVTSPRQRHTLPHEVPNWVKNGSLYFLTICGKPRGKNQFCHSVISAKIIETVTHRHASEVWFMRLFLLMPDHVHALVSFPQEANLLTSVRQWKNYVARMQGIKWQRDFFEHRLRNAESWEEKAHYIRQNPVRAGLIANAEAWAYRWEPA